MKKIAILALSVSVLFASCSKKSNNAQPTDLNQVTISGTSYSTVKIGTQTWTSLNYNGPGGVNYGNVTGDLVGSGKLYTYAEATAVQLPSGWRLPTKDDVNKLLASIGGTKNTDGNYEATGSIAGHLVQQEWPYAYEDDSMGFHAYGFGYYNSVGSGSFEYKDQMTAFWTSSPVPALMIRLNTGLIFQTSQKTMFGR
jgi:uncharacterized protein (TIGR02145 family)